MPSGGSGVGICIINLLLIITVTINYVVCNVRCSVLVMMMQMGHGVRQNCLSF